MVDQIKNGSSEEEIRPKRIKKEGPKEEPFSITSLMDIMTIILVFLLKSYSVSPVNVTPTEDLQLPISNAKLDPVEAVPITISKNYILVDDKPVVEVKNGKVDASEKSDGESGFLIDKVYNALKENAEKQKTIAQYNDAQQFKGMALLIADESTPYRLLTEVLYSAGQAEFGNFKFVVLKKE